MLIQLFKVVISAVLVITAVLVSAVVLPVSAQSTQDLQSQLEPGRRAPRAPSALQEGQLLLSERQAVSRARSQFSGNVLRISLVGDGNNRRYQIRMEKEGKVFTVFVHARTGKITRGG